MQVCLKTAATMNALYGSLNLLLMCGMDPCNKVLHVVDPMMCSIVFNTSTTNQEVTSHLSTSE